MNTPDPRTTTGAFAVVTDVVRAAKAGQKYGRRDYDKPLWWVFLYHGAKALVQVLFLLAVFGIAAWAHRCGVKLPLPGVIP